MRANKYNLKAKGPLHQQTSRSFKSFSRVGGGVKHTQTLHSVNAVKGATILGTGAGLAYGGHKAYRHFYPPKQHPNQRNAKTAIRTKRRLR